MNTTDFERILDQGVAAWNLWRLNNPETRPNLRGVDLRGRALRVLYPEGPYGEETRVYRAVGNDFSRTDLVGANLSGVYFDSGSFESADLTDSDLTDASFHSVDFSWARVDRADFRRASLGWCIFGHMDLSAATGLSTVVHQGPSNVSVDTLYRSAGNIPQAFLQGCGLPDVFITQLPALIAAREPITFDSCFISYSHKDEAFARLLHARLRAENIRAWFAPEDVKAGEKLYEQIDRAIHLHDRLLVILSNSSLRSNWVATEIRRARKAETREGRRKLFPIRLVDYEELMKWECFDADAGKDLAVEVREYFIPDFSHWTEPGGFEPAFSRLAKALKVERLVKT